MMTKVRWGLYASGLLLLSWGCGPTYPECHNDDHCSSKNEVCVNGQCTQCRDDSHCGSGPCSVCNNYACTRLPGCCTVDADCPGGRCIENRCTTECDANRPCPPGKRCVDGSCVEYQCGPDKPCPAGQKCIDWMCVGGCSPQTVYFDYKQSNIRLSEESKMRGNADCIKQNGGAYRLEGHTDVRGTEEYNMALSEDRSKSARAYLQNLGANAGYSVIGYGEERPACTSGGGEDCHQQNRRVEFKRN